MPAVRSCSTCLSKTPCLRPIDEGSVGHLEHILWNKKTGTSLRTHEDLRTKKSFGNKARRQLSEATGCRFVIGKSFSKAELKVFDRGLHAYRLEQSLCPSCMLTQAIDDKDDLFLPLMPELVGRPRSAVRRKVMRLLKEDQASHLSCTCDEMEL